MEKRIKVEFTKEELKLIRLLCRGEIVFLRRDIKLNMAVYGKGWTLSKIDTAKKIHHIIIRTKNAEKGAQE